MRGKVNKTFSLSFNSRNNKGNKRKNRNPNTWFRYGSKDQYIANILKLENSEKKVVWNSDNPKACAYKLTEVDKHRKRVQKKKSLIKYPRLWHNFFQI